MKVIDRGGFIVIMEISGEKVVMGKIQGGMNEIVVKWRIVLLVVASLKTIAMSSSINPPGRGV